MLYIETVPAAGDKPARPGQILIETVPAVTEADEGN